jgi:catechol-2,3-dioxygenase
MVHMPGIFTAYLQVSDLERSLSFYRDGLGLEADWNDGTLAVLRSPGSAAHTLVLREVGNGAERRLGEVGVTRIAWEMTGPADLDGAEERLSEHAVHYQRVRETDADRIFMRDPDGLTVILFHAGEPAPTGKPPASLYWYR